MGPVCLSMYFLVKNGGFADCHVIGTSGVKMVAYYNPYMTTWRIIPVSKWLGSPPFISHEKAIWKGSHVALLRGLTIKKVINHLLTAMILQVEPLRGSP